MMNWYMLAKLAEELHRLEGMPAEEEFDALERFLSQLAMLRRYIRQPYVEQLIQTVRERMMKLKFRMKAERMWGSAA